MERSLQEFRVRGVKTNIPFLIKLVTHPAFLALGQPGAPPLTTRFVDETPALYDLPKRRDRGTRVLTYIADVIVNGHPLIAQLPSPVPRAEPPLPETRTAAPAKGTRDLLREMGRERFCAWILGQKRLLLTDTTFRDAHQSLLATRMRTHDMLRIAPYYADRLHQLFSLEMWGGATFDSAMRFLRESPWARLSQLRELIPNLLFQMLLRSASAVGYTNYPDNVVRQFVRQAAGDGIDLFRVFDALNGLPNLFLAIDAVREADALCEAAICYTGDILDPRRTKYTLSYYVDLAGKLEERGADLLAIKDMAGLCKPYAARELFRALRKAVKIPIHFHTHDCAGGQIASLLNACDEGVDIVDGAQAPFSAMTSQPSLYALAEALRFHERDPGLDMGAVQEVSDYWAGVRHLYGPFETGQLAPTADVYENEMPGGQYTNLYQQARALGLEGQWRAVCRAYAEVNRMFGDIVKVTPTSKVVGDMALFMVANGLTRADVEGERELAFPESVVEFFEGRLGEPAGGFPEKLQKKVLRGREPIRGRPGESLPPADFEATGAELKKVLGREADDREVMSHLLYPRVFPEFASHQARYSDTSVLPTPVFFYGMEPGQEVAVEIERGKTLIVKFLTVGDPHEDGTRTVFFELNGQPRSALVVDRSLGARAEARPKAEAGNPLHVGAPMPGLVVQVAVLAGEEVDPGQKLLTLEAMKMETTLHAERGGKVAQVLVKAGTQVETGDLLLRLEE
jgi:pyruvate carboxylase